MAESMARISLTTIVQFRRSTVANTAAIAHIETAGCERNRPGGVRCLFAESRIRLQ